MTSLAGLRDRRLVGAPTRTQAVAYGASAFPANLMLQTFSAFVVFFYVDRLGVPAGWVAGAMVAHGILNAVLNPLVGAASDRRRTRWGRRVPWIVLGIVPLVVAFALVWMPPPLPPAGLVVWFLLVVAVFDVAYVAVVLNVSALFPEIFRTTAERARGNAPRQLFALVGMILGTAGAPLLYDAIGWTGMGVALAVVCAAFFAWSLLGMVERDADDAVRARESAVGLRDQLRYTFANRAFVTYVLGSLLLQSTTAVLLAGIPFYVKYTVGGADADATLLLAPIFVAAIPAIWGWSWVVRRLGPRTTMLAVVAVYGLATCLYLLPTTVLGAAAAGIAVGLGVAGLMQVLEVALAQVIDDDEGRTGLRREGMYFGANGFVVRGSVVVQAVVVAGALAASGYVEGASTQVPEVATGIRMLIGGVPVVLAALAFVCFWLYPLRSAVPSTPVPAVGP
ncbi:MFS transporter [Krasilnikoviella flava]|uniref:Glycoside/pentoside/hexuronide:cation symporter, GPH family n=1 Tax=Krasilnikoviella flava TaxID=526729 RepID=A0A1T5JYI7_9MICO|nr:MFS transporter [Krasilnikoviella flava]SKC56426.1 glycoside/pentoside/hexuronide:cation symporter, GPH family [Krasilnikoviella flava]